MSQNISIEAAFGQAQQLLNAKKYYGALRTLSTVSIHCSKNLDYLTLLAQTQAGLRDLANLIKTRKEIVRQRGIPQDKMNLMKVLYDASCRNEALDVGLDLQAEVLTTEEERALSRLLVKIFLEENDFEGAQEVIAKTIISESDDFLLWAQGVILLNADQKARALDYFRKSVQMNPKNDQAWVSLGMMHKEMGDEDLFIANLERAIDSNPYNTSALKMIATTATRNLQKAPTAFQHVRFYLTEFCFDEDISLCHIQMLCQTKQWETAELELEKLMLNQPSNENYKNLKKSMFEAQNMC